MLAYDPVSNLMEKVPMWGMSLSLMFAELSLQTPQVTSSHTPTLMPHPQECSPSDQSAAAWQEPKQTDSWKAYSEEWDEPEHGTCSHCPTPPLEGTLMWEEVMKESPCRENKLLVLEHDSQESDWELDGATENLREGHSESRIVQNSPRNEQLEESTPVPQCEETQMAASVGPSSQDIIQIHAVDDDLN